MCWLRVFAFGVLAALSHSIYAAETILNFHSDIVINKDASLDVTETITVNTEGKEIKRGIYRDFPTHYKDTLGTNYEVEFTLKNAMRDGQYESYHVEMLSNGIRIYLGKKDVYLAPGQYTYQIYYHVTRELGFFGHYDELYWNVTGNDSVFPIEKASATVHLPGSFKKEQLQWSAYNGYQDEKTHNYKVEINKKDNKSIKFILEKYLEYRQGFTISVGWPKGYVLEPSWRDKIELLFRNNPRLIVMSISLLVVTSYYLLVWLFLTIRSQRDKKIVIPHYDVLASISPAVMRYIYKKGYDKKVFSSAMMSLIVKNQISVSSSDGPLSNDAPSTDEVIIKNKWSNESKKFIEETEWSNEHKKILNRGKVYNDHKNYFESNFHNRYFYNNEMLSILGSALSWLGVAFIVFPVFDSRFVFMALAGFFVVTGIAIKSGQTPQDGKVNTPLIIFGFFLAFAPILFFLKISLVIIIYIASLALLNFYFKKLIPIYTKEGQKIINYALGIQEYLTVAEKQYLEVEDVPQSLPDYFEKLLPYAMALDLEEAWSNKVDKLVPKLSIDLADAQTSNTHSYVGLQHAHNHMAFVGDASTTAAASATIAGAGSATGSHSGSGGSHSGGGGGGGGGW